MTAVFLDLDGTIMDSKPGITASLRHAFEISGYGHHLTDDLTWMIGPPFQETFVKMGLTDYDPILAAYREHYQAGGMFEAEVYEGVMDALVMMRAAGYRLYLMTAKPHHYARKITAHFGIADHMTAEYGPELDGTRNWKGDLLAHALEETGERASASVMVGDRHHDMAAAAENDMPSIAARWGYGSADDWTSATLELDHARDLPDAVARVLGQRA